MKISLVLTMRDVAISTTHKVPGFPKWNIIELAGKESGNRLQEIHFLTFI
jgi:hypothetical protein